MRLARGLDEPDSPASDAYSLSKTLLLISWLTKCPWKPGAWEQTSGRGTWSAWTPWNFTCICGKLVIRSFHLKYGLVAVFQLAVLINSCLVTPFVVLVPFSEPRWMACQCRERSWLVAILGSPPFHLWGQICNNPSTVTASWGVTGAGLAPVKSPTFITVTLGEVHVYMSRLRLSLDPGTTCMQTVLPGKEISEI